MDITTHLFLWNTSQEVIPEGQIINPMLNQETKTNQLIDLNRASIILVLAAGKAKVLS